MSAKVGEVPIQEMVGLYEVSSVNDNGQRLVEGCAQRKILASVFRKKIYFY